MKNHLANETSPYLLQHAENPVAWYPWCDEAFIRAKKEDKPIFLSIGYSTCHWCHVMAHESFEDNEIADILNQHFISIKVDKEERPDIDSIYMSVCQALTGSGGWPTTIFMTPEQKPFFAGTYFPKNTKYGQIGFRELLQIINAKWKKERKDLVDSAEEILKAVNERYQRKPQNKKENAGNERKQRNIIINENIKQKNIMIQELEKQEERMPEDNAYLLEYATTIYKRTFDKANGGFGNAPKFPTPHNLLFLMRYYEKHNEKEVMQMVEKTLQQMYRGGIFDHIGGGFSRYSTDDYFLAPHFEKMLYDNALLLLAYAKAYQLTKCEVYCDVAKKTANYILQEMTHSSGGFYSAQDADSEGIEGKYYLFEPQEIKTILGDAIGQKFNAYYDITENGNFEGKSIPNLLKNNQIENAFERKTNFEGTCIHKEVAKTDSESSFSKYMSSLYTYRKNRYRLHLDDKILTAWNGLMIAAMCQLYRVTNNKTYLEAAKRAQTFIETELMEDGRNVHKISLEEAEKITKSQINTNIAKKRNKIQLYVSYRDGKRGQKAFLDDYANEIFALISLYEATLEKEYLQKAEDFCDRLYEDFYDKEDEGFFLYGTDNEQLIMKPKETYDGAVPSGNSMMAYNLVKLYYITENEEYKNLSEKQLAFISREAEAYPAGYAMFLMALLDFTDIPDTITIVPKEKDDLVDLSCKIPLDTIVRIQEANEAYPMKNNSTTFYICKGRSCKPPVNELT